MPSPLVSVVVNNHDYERFLPEAIESALAQRYPRTEVVVVDDGSTDGSRDVIDGYGDRINAVLQDNRGQPAALAVGLRAARGDLIVFLDADDVLLPDAAGSAAALLQDPAVVKVHWPMLEIDERGRPTGERRPDRPLKEGDLRELVIRDGPAPESYATPPTSGNAWSRPFLERVLPAPEGLRAATGASGIDSYLSTLAAVHGRIRRLDDVHSHYRVHGGNRYTKRAPEEKTAFDRRSFEYRCRALADHCRGMGIAVEPEAWHRRSWMERFPRARADIERVVPAGATLILVDEDDIGPEVADGRRVLPFPERDGLYWGPPADDASAIEEVERLRRAGAGFIVFGWPALWWLEHYAQLSRHLRMHYRCVLDNDRLVAFDLRA